MRIKPISSTVEPRVVGAPSVPMNIGTGFAQGLGELSRGLSQTANIMGEIAARKKNFDDSVSLTNLANEAKLAVHDLTTQIEGSEYNAIPEIREDGIQGIHDALSEKANAINPEVGQAWNKAWDTIKTDAIIDISKIETEKFKQNTISGVLGFMNLMEDEAIKASLEGDIEKVSLINDAVTNAVNNVRDNFNVPGTTAESWKERFKNSVETKVRMSIEKAKKLKEKNIITNAYMFVMQESQNLETGEPDYKKAYSLLRDPKNLTRYGITAEQKKELTLIIQSDEARAKEEQDAMHEEQRGTVQRGIMNGTISYDEIDQTALPEKEKYQWKTALEKRNKDIADGKSDPMKLYDPAKKAEISRLILTDPDKIKDKGGIDYIYSHVGKGREGGLTPEQAEALSKDFKNTGKPAKGPLSQQTYKEALGSLELFRKNWYFIDAEPGDSIDSKTQADNDYTYGKMVEELEQRVLKGEKPYEALQEIMKPYTEKKVSGMLERFFTWVGGMFGTPEIPETPEPESTGTDKRAKAIEILRKNNKVVNDETIQKVMEQL